MARVTKANIEEMRELLLSWSVISGRHFPWREKGLTDYEIVIAEVLLQRTKAETVAKFYLNFLKEFPSWYSIVKSDIEDVENYLKPVGLYRQRASRLKKLAEEMLKREGVFPQDREDLESIPFLGQYIANAIELIIFNQPSPLVDVNMARVLERYFGNRKMADIRYDPYLQKLARLLVNHPSAKEVNWAVLDFAALICKALKPACETCFLNKKCNYFRLEKVNKIVDINLGK